MRNKDTILISAVGGDIGQGVLRSLELSKKRVRTIGLDVTSEASGLYMCDKGYVVPKASDATAYIKRLTEICKKENVVLAFICNEAEQFVVASYAEKLGQSLPTIFIVQPRPVLDISLDKLATYRFLEKRGIRVPKTAVTPSEARELIRECGFPLILKSRRGAGSKHLHHVTNNKEFAEFWKSVPEPLLQEFVRNESEDEYTVGVFLDRESRSCGSIAMLRKLRYGLTWTAIADNFPDVSALAVQVAEAIKAVGPCNVQMRRDREGALCILEINARISSTTPLRALLGFNEVSASLDYFLRGKYPSFTVRSGFAMKKWSELVVPRSLHTRLLKNKVIERE